MEAGMSFFWFAGKQPCMITADYRYIFILEINAKVPVYAPCFEKFNNAFLGTFTVMDNAYSARCGIGIVASGHIFTMLKLCDDDDDDNVKKTRAANTVFSGDREHVGTMRDAFVQIDAPPEHVTFKGSASVMCGERGVPALARNRGPSGIDSKEKVQSVANVLLKTVYKMGFNGETPR